ncbi:MAG: hypothetical protein LBP59_18780 [Planctomycetaceae bacterium]|nr:hypothetical protein [Planctomycetaceae bacterium]
MRVYDILYFLEQIFFPLWAKQQAEAEAEAEAEDSEVLTLTGKRSIIRSGGVIGLLFHYWGGWFRRIFSLDRVGTLISIFIHLLIFLLLSFFFFPLPYEDGLIDIIARQGEYVLTEIKSDADVRLIDPLQPQEKDAGENANKLQKEIGDLAIKTDDVNQDQTQPPSVPNTTAEITLPMLETDNPQVGGSRWERSGFQIGGGFGDRNNDVRSRLAGSEAGKRGEDAIEAALEWFVAHQDRHAGSSYGSWSFDFRDSCGICTNSGTHKSRIAATGIVTLAFLGAGYTHERSPDNKYRKVVDDALVYLITQAIDTERGASLNHGLEGMYSQGIAAIALCEAAAMQKNKRKNLLWTKAQDALRFIENAQDRDGGGWRYIPNERPGDISVTAWQVMALKSGKLANMNISGPVLYKVNDFLDLVAYNGGREYSYLPINYKLSVSDQLRGTGADSAWTSNATGLLLRMYLSWEAGAVELDDGVRIIAKKGPLKIVDENYTCNLYYAYYGTLLMHHYGEKYWENWYGQLREFLVKKQAKNGHEAGSWYFPDFYCDKGGRLLNTALAVLILETPYRYLPLYKK